jgi:hypothetical protein
MRMIFAVCSLLFVFAGSSLRAEDAKWLEFPAGLSYALVENDDQLSVRIPVNLLPGAPDALNISANRRDVFSAVGRPNSLGETLVLTWVAGKQDVGPSILLSAKAADVFPGNYTLVVEFLQKEKAPGQRPQTVTLSLECPAPKLVSLRSVSIWQERRWPLGTNSTSGKLNLYEESGKAAARDITFNELRTASSLLGPETGSLKVSLETATVAAGKEAQARVSPEGDFPLGKTTGKLRVKPSNSAAPLVVDYEVSVTRTPVLIAICAALGAFFGWLSRVFLQSRREWLNAQITASETLALMHKARGAICDAKFKAAIAQAEDDLKQAHAKRLATQLMEAVAKAKSALADAESELSLRRKILSDSLVPLHRSLHQGWRLPLKVAEALSNARALASGILAMAEAQDIAGAAAKLDHEMPNARLALANAASEWRANGAKYFDALASFPPALPEQGEVRLREACTAWKQQFGEAQISAAVDDAALVIELSTTHAAYVQAKRIVDDLQQGGREISKWLQDLFIPSSENPSFKLLVSIIAQHGINTLADLESPAENRGAPAERQTEEIVAWERALLSVLPKHADPNLVTKELAKYKWISAAQIAKELLNVRELRRPRALAPEGVLAAESTSPKSTDLAVPQARGVVFQVSPILGTTSRVDLLRASLELTGSLTERIEFAREEARMSFAQSAILSCVFIMLAYGFYGSQWVGTSREMLGVFAWAFGLDLTADSLAPLLKKFGTTPTT